MFKMILRLLAEVAFYTITMPIKILCLMIWAVWCLVDIVMDPEDGIESVKIQLQLMKEVLKFEARWIKTGSIY